MKKKYLLVIALLPALVLAAYFIFSSETASRQNTKSNADKTAPGKDSDPKQREQAFNKSKYSYDDSLSIWVVANKQRPLQPKSFVPGDLVKPAAATKGTQYLRSEAAAAVVKMFDAAKAEGLMLRIDSAYRSYTTQVAVYNNEVKTYGKATADTQSARPGHSEHQTGLAADLGAASGKCSIADCFAAMAEGKWLAANAHKYGFIMRYAEGKQSVTGYRHEPWHFRYVGTELAEEMKAQNILTLEEFFGLPAAPNYN